jgi:hypothetical protein
MSNPLLEPKCRGENDEPSLPLEVGDLLFMDFGGESCD